MSTRAHVLVKGENGDKFLFYRHNDGYPEGVKDSLDKFTSLAKERKIRKNAEQASGWLILIGAEETKNTRLKLEHSRTEVKNYQIWKNEGILSSEPFDNPLLGWKAGEYEPAASIHGDIEHLYIVDLPKEKWYEVKDIEKTIKEEGFE